MSEISNIDPFSKIDSWFITIKNLEKRWGLTLVSFLPPIAQKRVALLQAEISKLVYRAGNSKDPCIEFYEPSYLHCTHLTLVRSNGWGPITAQEFVKPRHDIFELFKAIHKVTSRVQFIKVKLGPLRMSSDGLGIVLSGRCMDDESERNRRVLLENLNNDLPKSFNLCRRSWDIDTSKYHKLHCRVAFLKRPIDGYEDIVNKICAIKFVPISFTIKSIVLVHHRYRSLQPPHQGKFPFPLGVDIKAKITADEFIRKLNLEG